MIPEQLINRISTLEQAVQDVLQTLRAAQTQPNQSNSDQTQPSEEVQALINRVNLLTKTLVDTEIALDARIDAVFAAFEGQIAGINLRLAENDVSIAKLKKRGGPNPTRAALIAAMQAEGLLPDA